MIHALIVINMSVGWGIVSECMNRCFAEESISVCDEDYKKYDNGGFL